MRPVCPGASIGHPHGFSGSLGGFVRSRQSGDTLLLSSASALWPTAARKGDYIHQPGSIDNPLFTGETRVALISDDAPLSAPARSRLDAGYARLLDGIEISGNVVPSGLPEAGRPIGPPAGPPQAGDRVAKIGRGTGLTLGTISALSAHVALHPVAATRNWTASATNVTGVLAISGEGALFSGPGDAGAVIFRLSDLRAVGLLFGSSREDKLSYAHDLSAVLHTLHLVWQ
jgi:hypothetical protein